MPTPGSAGLGLANAPGFAWRVFVSYDHDNDRLYRRLLEAWNANGEFAFDFSDPAAGSRIEIGDEGALQRAVARKIGAAQTFLCLVGRDTHRCARVEWEIARAVALGKEIVAVKIDSSCPTPPALIEAGARWASSFTLDAIRIAGGRA